MKMKFIGGLTRAALVAGALCVAASSAQAGTYNFTQGGFDDGSSISGYFTGTDNNHDGYLANDEVTDFYALVSGGGYLDTFQWGYSYYYHGIYLTPTVVYKIGSHAIGDDPNESLYVWSTVDIGYGAGPGGGGTSSFGSLVAQTGELVQVTDPTPVPEPSSWAMMLGGLSLVGAATRRRRA